MKKLVLFLVLLMNIVACTSRTPEPRREMSTIKPEKNDDGEWDLVVIDDRFDYFMSAIAKPVSQYSESYLKTKNAMLVSEWNGYYYSGRHRDAIESSIDYNPQENYGLNFEYKLYQVFAYVQWRYGLKLNGLSGAEVRR